MGSDLPNYIIREMTIDDHAELLKLWESIDGLYLDEEDSHEHTLTFLNRNSGLSYVATVEGKIIATIKGAQDGRRGYISHMVVLPQFQSLGIAKALFEKTLFRLKEQGIWKCNLYVLNSNPAAIDFWKHNGWNELDRNFTMLQKNMRHT